MPEFDATEAAADFAAEHGIDLAEVTGSGAGGRITKGDVEAAMKATEPAPDADGPQPTTPQPTTLGVFTPVPGDADIQNGLTEPERRRLLVADVTAHMRSGSQPDQFGPEQEAELAQIQAASSIQELLTIPVDRQRYAGALQARAKALLEHKP